MRLFATIILCLLASVASAGKMRLHGGGGGVTPPGAACAYGSGAPDGCAASSATNSFQLPNFFTSDAPQSSQTYQSANFTGVVASGVLTVSGLSGTVHVNDTLTGSGVPAGVVVASGANPTWNLNQGGVAASGLGISSRSMATVSRPPWNVAGVDYPIGIDLTQVPGGVLRDPNTIAGGNCLWTPTNGSSGNGTVACSSDGGTGVDLNGYDFSLHGCTYLTFTGTVTGPIKVRNSKFVAGGGAFFNGTMTSGAVVINSGQQGFPVIGQYITGAGIPAGTTITGGTGSNWTTSASGTSVGPETMTTGNGTCGYTGTFKNVNVQGGSTFDFSNNYVDGCVLTTGVTNVAADCTSATQFQTALNVNYITISGAVTGAVTIGPYNVFLNTSRSVADTDNGDFTWKYNYGEQTGNGVFVHGEQGLLNYPGNLNTTTPLNNYAWLYSTYLGPTTGQTQGTTAPISVYEGAIPTSQSQATAAISGGGVLLTVSGGCNPASTAVQVGMNVEAISSSQYLSYVVASLGTGTGCVGTYNLTGPATNIASSLMGFSFASFNNVDIEGNTVVMNCALSAGGCGFGNPSATSGSAVEFAYATPMRVVTLKNNYIDPTGAFRCWNATIAMPSFTISGNVNMRVGSGADPDINTWTGFSTGTCADHS